MGKHKLTMPLGRAEDLKRSLLLLQRISTFIAFLLIPFLGGNDLPLYFVSIDRFWIETSFTLSLIVALFTHYLAGRRPDRCFGRFLLCAFPFAAMCMVSFIYTWNRFSTLNEINLFAWSIGAVFVYLSAENRDELHEALIAGSVLLVLSAVIQLTILLPGLAQVFADGKYGQMVRDQVAPFGAFLNQNMLGGYFLYTLPLALYFVMVRKKKMYALAASVLMLGILLSLSRLAMIIGFAGVLTACALFARKADPRWLIKLVCSVGCALAVFAILLHGDHREETSTMRNLLGTKVERASKDIRSLDKRTGLWRDSYRIFLSKPVVGYGAGTFQYAYKKFYDGGSYTKYAHGSIAKTAVELGSLGLLGLFFYLAAFGGGLVGGLRGSSSKFLAVSALSGLLFGILDFALDTPAHFVMFFVVTSAFIGRKQDSKPMIAGRPVLLSLAVVLCFSFLFTLRADLSRKLVEDGILAEEAGLVDRAYTSYEDAVHAMPMNNDGYVRIVSTLLKSYDNEKDPQNRKKVELALSSYLREMEQNTDRDSELYFMRGMCRSALAPGKDACAMSSKAITLYPSSGHYVFEAARCYAALGDFDEALGVISRIEPYLAGFRASDNPQGLFVYKLRDLEADIEYARGNPGKALAIERENLLEGASGKYSIYNSKAGEFMTKEMLIEYLTQKVRFYEKAVKNQ